MFHSYVSHYQRVNISEASTVDVSMLRACDVVNDVLLRNPVHGLLSL